MSNSTSLRTTETDLLRRALAGDQKAKNEIEAKDLLAKADRAALDLRHRASNGDQAAMNQLRQLANGMAAAGVRPTASSPSPAAVGIARTAAAKAERKRWADVFASEHAKGREHGCAALLANDKGWSAAQIIAELPSLPTDSERAAGERRANADAAWNRARERVDADRAAKSPTAGRVLAAQAKAKGGQASEDRWAKAYAKVQGSAAR